MVSREQPRFRRLQTERSRFCRTQKDGAEPRDEPPRPLSLLRRSREDQRFDNYGHGSRGWDQSANIYEVEIIKRNAVDGDDRIFDVIFFLEVKTDNAADIPIIDQH